MVSGARGGGGCRGSGRHDRAAGEDAPLLALIGPAFGTAAPSEGSERDRLLMMDAVSRWLDAGRRRTGRWWSSSTTCSGLTHPRWRSWSSWPAIPHRPPWRSSAAIGTTSSTCRRGAACRNSRWPAPRSSWKGSSERRSRCSPRAIAGRLSPIAARRALPSCRRSPGVHAGARTPRPRRPGPRPPDGGARRDRSATRRAARGNPGGAPDGGARRQRHRRRRRGRRHRPPPCRGRRSSRRQLERPASSPSTMPISPRFSHDLYRETISAAIPADLRADVAPAGSGSSWRSAPAGGCPSTRLTSRTTSRRRSPPARPHGPPDGHWRPRQPTSKRSPSSRPPRHLQRWRQALASSPEVVDPREHTTVLSPKPTHWLAPV